MSCNRNKWQFVSVPDHDHREAVKKTRNIVTFKRLTAGYDPSTGQHCFLLAAIMGSDDCTGRVQRPRRTWKRIRGLRGCNKVYDWSNDPCNSLSLRWDVYGRVSPLLSSSHNDTLLFLPTAFIECCLNAMGQLLQQRWAPGAVSMFKIGFYGCTNTCRWPFTTLRQSVLCGNSRNG